MSNPAKFKRFLIFSCTLVVLASCGGSSGSGSPDSTVPKTTVEEKADSELVQSLADVLLPALADKGEVNRACLVSILSNMSNSEVSALTDSASPEMVQFMSNASKCVATTTLPPTYETVDIRTLKLYAKNAESETGRRIRIYGKVGYFITLAYQKSQTEFKALVYPTASARSSSSDSIRVTISGGDYARNFVEGDLFVCDCSVNGLFEGDMLLTAEALRNE
jgi:hypothetical protein